MQLEKMTARIRPRKPNESMDLGIMLVQKWWGKIAFNWLVVTLPVFIVINYLLHEHYIWSIIVFWWLLPIFDRIPLHIISRTLFGEVESNKSIFKSLPGILFPNIIKMLTYLRLDPGRSFNLPVWQLERLRGNERSARARVLNKTSGGSAFFLTFMFIILELVVFFAMIQFAVWFTPEAYAEKIKDALNPFNIDNGDWAGLVINVFAYITFLIIEPFYVAAGFSLYINRRTQLEGWDIEIIFRQLAHRIAKPAQNIAGIVLVALILATGLLQSSTPAYADVLADPNFTKTLTQGKLGLTNAEARKSIDEILAQDDFNNKKIVTKWKKIKKETDEDEKSFWEKIFDWFFGEEDDERERDNNNNYKGVGSGLGVLAEFFLWVIIAAAAAFAIFFVLRWAPTIRARENRIKRKKLPNSLFGMEITPESLPEDVGMAAMELWRQQKHLQALSLLYRGALTTLVHHHGINLKDSATEGDCIRVTHLYKERLSQNSVDYFKQLTLTWQKAAYAHRLPDEQEVTLLCGQWASHFEM